jgi:site-specific recombinase XerD
MSNTSLTPIDPLAVLIDEAVKGLQSAHTRKAYERDMLDFADWLRAQGAIPLNKAAVSSYRNWMISHGRGETAVNRALSAIRKMLREAADNGHIDPRDAESAAKVEGIKRPGVRTGNWLTIDEMGEILNAPDDAKMRGKRDRAVLALLSGAGLRREELAGLTVEHIQQREGRWVIVDIRGKRNKLRTIPIAAWVKTLVDRWCDAAGIASGPVVAQLSKGGSITADATTTKAIFRVVRKYGRAIGKPTLAPHDLRRTYAKLARGAGAPLEQIQITLGHESLDTTKRYIGSELDYQNAPGDFLKPNVRLRA